MAKTYLIYDTSNSSKRPSPRGLGGPIENDIVRYLKKYAHLFNFAFVEDINKSDIVFTNDVFPLEKYSQPLVKRMDGVYSLESLKNRNSLLNYSASIADHVIFISEFSKKSLNLLYPDIFNLIKNYSVAVNAVDFNEFYQVDNKIISTHHANQLKFISSANDFNRLEKRLIEVLFIASKFPQHLFYFIGNLPNQILLNQNLINVPKNTFFLDYINNYSDMNLFLNDADAFIYLGFNDACPKTVCQAMNCKLPLFLTNSGGNSEMAKNNAIYVPDYTTSPIFHDSIPKLNQEEIILKFNHFLNNFSDLKQQSLLFDSKQNFFFMLEQYFSVFKNFT